MTTEHQHTGKKDTFDIQTIWRDVRKQMVVLIFAAAAVSMLAFIWHCQTRSPEYTVEATYAVNSMYASGSKIDDLTNAQNVAVKFSQVISSNVMRKRVQEDLGDEIAPGTIVAEAIPETNLISLKVTSPNINAAFHTVKSVMKNYRSITDLVVGDTRLSVLVQPRVPPTPNREMLSYIFMGKVFLICLGVLLFITVLLSYFKDTVRNGTDAEAMLEAEYLGAISHEVKYRTIRDRLKKTKKPLLISSPAISFQFVESTMKVARRVQTRLTTGKIKTLLVTSCMENEGKSTAAANLALALANNGQKVGLMDMDLRKPAQRLIFGIDREDENNIHKVGKNVDLYLFSGLDKYFGKEGELEAAKVAAFIDQIGKSLDVIIIDTAPVDQVSDTEAIASIADASLFVVREHTALVKNINNAIENISCYRAAPIGCVLNDSYAGWQESMGGYEYRRRYGYGYGNGYGYER